MSALGLNTAGKVTAAHLARTAFLYVRQSTLRQPFLITSRSGAGPQRLGPRAGRWTPGAGVGGRDRRRGSLCVRPEPGNAAEVSLIARSLEGLRELSGPAAC